MSGTPYLNLKEFDLVLFRPGGNWIDQLVGKGICQAERDMGCKDPEFCHVAVAMVKDGSLKLFQTNPPSPSYRELDSVDWDNVAVLAFTGSATSDQVFNARWWCDQKTTKGADPYGFASILGFLGLALLGKVSKSAVADVRSGANRVSSQTREVCSQIVDDLFYDTMHLDILPLVGEGQAVPGDLTGSVLHQHVFGKLGV